MFVSEGWQPEAVLPQKQGWKRKSYFLISKTQPRRFSSCMFSTQYTRDKDVSISAWWPYEGKVERLAIRRFLSCKRSTVSSVKQRRQARFPGTLHVASAYPWLNITFVMLYEPLAGGC
jgi:hypothetical protein